MTESFRSKAPEIKTFSNISLPTADTTELANGCKCYFFRNNDQPIVKFTASLQGGKVAAQNPAAFILMSQLLKEGTAKYSGAQISELLDFDGSWFKADPDNFHIDLTFHSLTKNFATVADIMSQMLSECTFPEKEFGSIKERIYASSATKQTKVSDRAKRLNDKLFFGASHPYVVSSPLADDFKTVTLDDVRSCYESMIKTVLPEFHIAGDIDSPMRLLDAAQFREEKRWPGKKYVESEFETNFGQQKICCPEAKQSAVAISFPTIGRNHPDYITLRFAVMMLGGFFGSRLMKNIREENGLTYGIGSSLLGHREGGQILITSQTDVSYVDRLLSAVENEINKIQSKPVTHTEIEELRGHAMSSLASILDSPFSILDYNTTIRRIGVTPDYFTRQVETLKSLTPEAVTAVLSRHIDINKSVVTIAGK